MPSGEMLRERIEAAELPELLMLSGRLMPRQPGAGSARGQTLVLSILAGREALSQRELQQMLGVQPGSMSEIVSKLEKKGYLTRERGEDRRGNLLRITEAGRNAIPRQPDEAGGGELFAALTDEQQDTLRDLLKALLNDWAGRLDREPHGMPEFGRGRPPMPPARPARPMPSMPSVPGAFIPLDDAPEDGDFQNRGPKGGIQI